MTDSTPIPNGIRPETARNPNASCAGAPQARSTATDTGTSTTNQPARPSMTLTGPRANHRPVDNPTADAITVMDGLRRVLRGEPR